MSKRPSPLPPRSPEEFDRSADPKLWDLLEQVSHQKASSLLSRQVLREIRMQDEKTQGIPWGWLSFLRPSWALSTAIPLFIAMAWILVAYQRDRDSSLAEQDATLSEDVVGSLEEFLQAELLCAAADEPDLFSDEEVLAMLF